MKIDEIFEEVLKISIIEIFNDYGYKPIKRGNNYILKSPFRQTNTDTSFTISESRNSFHDWVDQQYSGNSIKLVSLLCNLTYYEACLKIAYEHGIIDEKAYSFYVKKKVKKEDSDRYQRITIEKKKENKIADIYTRDKVYRMFFKHISYKNPLNEKLSEKHLEYLKDHRKLSDEKIKQFMFFTFPTRGILGRFLKDIEKEFGNQDVLKGIPGFFKRKNEPNFTFKGFKGIGIPIIDENGLFVAIQVRLDGEDLKLRYFWFSSASVDDDCEEGVSSGSPVDVIFPDQLLYKGIFITEGKFKAIKIAEKFNCVVISVQGVSTWRQIISCLNEIKDIVNKNYPEFKDTWKIQMIYTAFDADLCENFAVFKQLKAMTDEILKSVKEEVRGQKFGIKYLYWDVLKAKGIDDLINISTDEELKNSIIRYDKDIFDKAYDNLIQKILELKGFTNESEILSKIKSDEFLIYFINHLF